MDLGLHPTLDDSQSIAYPEILAIAETINPLMSSDFGKVWDLFSTRPQPFATDEYQILNRTYSNPETSLGTVGVATDWDTTTATTALPMDSATLDRVTVGDILLFDSEIVVISAVSISASTIDVYERGSGDTVAATHLTGAVAKIIGNAHVEGKVDATAMAETTDTLTNYCQILEESVDLSKEDSDQARKIGQTADVLKKEAMERVMQDLARTAIYGTARAGTASIPASTRGLISHLNDVSGSIKTAVGGAFTETSLKDAALDVRNAGGSINAIVLSVNNKRIANGFSGINVNTITSARQDTTAGRLIDGYLLDGFGVVPFVVDIAFPDDKVALVNSRFMSKGWKNNDALRFVPETNVGSRERKETLQGKFGLAMEQVGRSHALLTDIT